MRFNVHISAVHSFEITSSIFPSQYTDGFEAIISKKSTGRDIPSSRSLHRRSLASSRRSLDTLRTSSSRFLKRQSLQCMLILTRSRLKTIRSLSRRRLYRIAKIAAIGLCSLRSHQALQAIRHSKANGFGIVQLRKDGLDAPFLFPERLAAPNDLLISFLLRFVTRLVNTQSLQSLRSGFEGN